MMRSRPGRPREALIGGALGGGVGLLILLLARTGGGSPGIIEVVADAVARAFPAWLFDWGVKTLGPGAKGILIVSVCFGVPAVGAAIAWLLERIGLLARFGPILGGVALGVVAFAAGELLVMPLAGVGPAGRDLVSDAAAVHVPLAAAAIAYATVAIAWLALRVPRAVPGPAPAHNSMAEPASASRRSFMAGLIAILGLGALVASGLLVVSRIVPRTRPVLPGQVDQPGAEGFGFVRAVTPVPEFYFVSKDWVPMEIDSASWRLNVDGLVDRPRSWTLDDIRALPGQEGYRTLQCISAESITRSSLISNQRWKGARVRDLLAQAQPYPEARYIIWRCADGYHESLDLPTAMDDDTWLTYEMGPPGTPLAPDNGRPLRLLVAGRYGMAQPKYITDMILSADDEPGWWVKGGWQTDAPVRTYCRIDLPAADGISDSVLAGRPFTAFGVASSGDRGISAVQISLDRGATWRNAELEPIGGPIGRLTWVRWRADVQLDTPGQLLFMARAADGNGEWQTDEVSEPFPRGASGYPRVPMRVYASIGDPDGTG